MVRFASAAVLVAAAIPAAARAGPGAIHADAYRAPQLTARDIADLEKRCHLGEVTVCEVLAESYENGEGVPLDMARANAVYEKGCSLGSGSACNNLGVSYEKGSEVPQDMARANALFEKGCNLDDGIACENLGTSYEKGTGLPRDMARASTLFKKGCDLGDGIACDKLGQGLGKKNDRAVKATGNVMGPVEKELIRRVIQEHADQIRYCYETGLALNLRLQGKVTIKWIINADGSASSAQVERSATTLEDAKVLECMMSEITSWQFPKPKDGGIAVVSYPWILRSALSPSRRR